MGLSGLSKYSEPTKKKSKSIISISSKLLFSQISSFIDAINHYAITSFYNIYDFTFTFSSEDRNPAMRSRIDKQVTQKLPTKQLHSAMQRMYTRNCVYFTRFFCTSIPFTQN